MPDFPCFFSTRPGLCQRKRYHTPRCAVTGLRVTRCAPDSFPLSQPGKLPATPREFPKPPQCLHFCLFRSNIPFLAEAPHSLLPAPHRADKGREGDSVGQREGTEAIARGSCSFVSALPQCCELQKRMCFLGPER